MVGRASWLQNLMQCFIPEEYDLQEPHASKQSLSHEDPFEMAATRPRLSHWNNTLVLESLGPHTAHLKAIGTT